jgi:hypothetical protein
MDAQGILQACFDPTNNALRVTSSVEGQFIQAQELALIAGARTDVVTNGVHRLAQADAATTTYSFAFLPPKWWGMMGIGFVWTKQTALSGNARWRVTMKKIDLFIDNISEANFADVVANIAVPATAGVPLYTIDQLVNLDCTPGAFGTMYWGTISREGADALDTYNGGITELMGVIARRNPGV